jgi:hypothetical protein
MFSVTSTKSGMSTSLDPLDRVVVAFLTLPAIIFLIGWFEWWVAVPVLACMAYALMPLFAALPAGRPRLPITPLQIGVAVTVACAWTVLGGAHHIFFANADWHVRDAVLHDLVTSPWPVGYGLSEGRETMLRAPLAYYLPAALVGKFAGLSAAHFAMGLWTAMGSTLFLMQVLSLTPSRMAVAIAVAAIVVLFSGLDIVGSLLNDGPRFRSDWNMTTHLEWWAGKYQYSSMTTQLFWVPNHALGGWLLVGLLCRHRDSPAFDSTLPICVVALALWSPLTAIGILPFVLWKLWVDTAQGRLPSHLRPQVWAPALIVGIVVAGYLVLDEGRVSKGLAVGRGGEAAVMELLQQAQFFLLEAGFIGAAILVLRRSAQVAVALVVLAALPLAYLGPGNDLVMRASIPSLAVLAIGACLALVDESEVKYRMRKKAALCALLAIGAVTPAAEFARAVILPAWPINLQATLIGADCGRFAAHYVARLSGQAIGRLLRPPHRLALGPMGPTSCDNPGLDLMWQGSVK